MVTDNADLKQRNNISISPNLFNSAARSLPLLFVPHSLEILLILELRQPSDAFSDEGSDKPDIDLMLNNDKDKYCRRNEEVIIGKIDYHEQIKAAASENLASIDKDNRKVNWRQVRC